MTNDYSKLPALNSKRVQLARRLLFSCAMRPGLQTNDSELLQTPSSQLQTGSVVRCAQDLRLQTNEVF